jgi:hypothetical protein
MAAQRLSRRQKQILHWFAADFQRTRGMITSSKSAGCHGLYCMGDPRRQRKAGVDWGCLQFGVATGRSCRLAPQKP